MLVQNRWAGRGDRRLTIGCEFVHRADIDTPAVFQVEPLSDQKLT